MYLYIRHVRDSVRPGSSQHVVVFGSSSAPGGPPGTLSFLGSPPAPHVPPFERSFFSRRSSGPTSSPWLGASPPRTARPAAPSDAVCKPTGPLPFGQLPPRLPFSLQGALRASRPPSSSGAVSSLRRQPANLFWCQSYALPYLHAFTT